MKEMFLAYDSKQESSRILFLINLKLCKNT